MNPVSRAIQDIRTIRFHRDQINAWQKEHDPYAPKKGDLAPDFTLADTTGTQTVSLSDFHGLKAVALIFGSFT